MNTWNVRLSDETGAVTVYPLKAWWNPDKDFITDDLIGYAAASEAWYLNKKRTLYVPVGVELVERSTPVVEKEEIETGKAVLETS